MRPATGPINNYRPGGVGRPLAPTVVEIPDIVPVGIDVYTVDDVPEKKLLDNDKDRPIVSSSTAKVNGAPSDDVRPQSEDKKNDKKKEGKNPWVKLSVTEQSVGGDKADDVPLDLNKYDSLYDKPDKDENDKK